MMVYVGTREYRYGRMLMSHMAADNLIELHQMADQLGISRKHFQNKPGKPHYDICKAKKQEAIRLGALEVNDRLIVKLMKVTNQYIQLIEQVDKIMWGIENELEFARVYNYRYKLYTKEEMERLEMQRIRAGAVINFASKKIKSAQKEIQSNEITNHIPYPQSLRK